MPSEIEDRNYVKRKMGEAYAAWYWHRRWKDATKQQRVEKVLEYRRWRKLLLTAEPERNERGNIVWRQEDADRRMGGGGRGCYSPQHRRREWP